MEYKASHRFADMSARKIRPFADLIRGKSVDEALRVDRHDATRAETREGPRRTMCRCRRDPQLNTQSLNRPGVEADQPRVPAIEPLAAGGVDVQGIRRIHGDDGDKAERPGRQGLDSQPVLMELAATLFDREQISLGLAARIAGLSYSEMVDELGRRDIPVIRLAPGDLERELAAFGD